MTATSAESEANRETVRRAWIMRLADGLVIGGTAFDDSICLNDLWSRVTT